MTEMELMLCDNSEVCKLFGFMACTFVQNSLEVMP
jgi:hypothetical protein